MPNEEKSEGDNIRKVSGISDDLKEKVKHSSPNMAPSEPPNHSNLSD
jgi:hypothetical protein